MTRAAATSLPIDDALERARALLDDSEDAPSLSQLARAVGLSPTRLQRSFRKRFGVSPAEYARARRFAAFKRALRAGGSVADAVYAAGFGSNSRVYERSNRLLGMPPAQYRNGGKDAAIRYTTVACPLGRVLVAATTRGVCAVSLGDDDAGLLTALRAEFPLAGLQRIDAGRDEWLATVLAHVARQFNHRRAGAPLPALPPLDVAATAFQWRVWQALTRIPAGATRSYAEIAHALGAPDAARAVGRACGANHLALLVPCHRVVRADGSVGGWRWGVARKQRLLAGEQGG